MLFKILFTSRNLSVWLWKMWNSCITTDYNARLWELGKIRNNDEEPNEEGKQDVVLLVVTLGGCMLNLRW